MTRDEKVLPETRVCCQCCANVCSRSQALGVVCSRCPTTIEIAPPPENSLIFCMSHAVPHEEGPLEIVGPTASRLAEQIQYLALAQI